MDPSDRMPPTGFAEAIAHRRTAVRERERVRLAVHAALRRAAPADVDAPFDYWRRPGGLQLIHDYLDTLIDVVRAAPQGDAARWRAEARRRVCPGCKESIHATFCPLADAHACLLDRHLDLVLETIHDALAPRGAHG